MIPGSFDYHAPTSIDEAVQLLQTHGYDAKVLAGGQSLIPAMRFRLAMPEVIIDINQLSDLRYIRAENGHLAIGALTHESSLDESEIVQSRYPLLADPTMPRSQRTVPMARVLLELTTFLSISLKMH